MESPSNTQQQEEEQQEQQQIKIESSDIIRLIQHHLTECGLHTSSKSIRNESGIKRAGIASGEHDNIRGLCGNGRWDEVLTILDSLDGERFLLRHDDLWKDVHEMTILELGDCGEVELAFAAWRIAKDFLDDDEEDDKKKENGHEMMSNEGLGSDESRSNSIRRRLEALSSLRSISGNNNNNNNANSSSARSRHDLIPPDYYGGDNMSRQKRRDEIGRRLSDVIPVVPSSRLVCLLQQALKWQVHTAQIPQIKRLWDNQEDEDEEEEDDGKGKKKRRHKKKKKKKTRKEFDLILGEVEGITNIESTASDDDDDSKRRKRRSSSKKYERIATDPYTRVKFGKRSRCECATFLADGGNSRGGSSLITGSSDGLIEIWDSESKFTTLRTHDLSYQASDDLIAHDDDDDDDDTHAVTALAVSNDSLMLGTASSKGSICIWNISNGKCLRKFATAHSKPITCLRFNADSTRVLSSSYDMTAREFGLRGNKMLKEFRGHSSYVNCCSYVLSSSSEVGGGTLLVVTGSADGTARVWDGRTSEILHILSPSCPSASSADTSIQTDAIIDKTNVHSVLPLHLPMDTVIIVSRSPVAYLMNYSGAILRRFKEEDDTPRRATDFVLATVSPSNKWLYVCTEDGRCLVFDVSTGKVVKVIVDFAEESTGGVMKGSENVGVDDTGGIKTRRRIAEITGLIHHPNRDMIACFSNDKGQKKGLLTVWK